MSVPNTLRDRQQWLVWRFEEDPKRKAKKLLKVPYYATGRFTFESKRHGTQGSDEDRARLVRYDQALAYAPKAGTTVGCGGVGFAFLPGDGLIGIDLDAVIDPETGEIQERAREIIVACNSFTEYSPSGKGVHIFVQGETTSNKSNDIGVEMFCGRQFFTFTGQTYSGPPEDVNPIAPEVLERLHKLIDTAKGKHRERKAPAAQTGTPDDEARRVEAALVYVDAEDYHQWVEIGLALKQGLGEAGFGIWDRWSARSGKYEGSAATSKKWASFEPSGALTLGTVFELAKRGGWQPPRGAGRGAKRAAEKSAVSERGESGSLPPEPPDGGAPPPDHEDAEDGLPVIKVVAGMLSRTVDQAEMALMDSKEHIFQRAGYLVRIVRRDVPSVRHYRRAPGVLGLHTVDQPYLIESMTRSARWKKWNGQAQEWRAINCPEQVAATMLARVGRWNFPRLWSVISAPTLRPDGTVLQKPGYDAETATWYDPAGVKFPTIPESPTRADAEAALAMITGMFDTVPFDTPVDKAVFLSLLLTGLVRRSLPSAPLGAMTAPAGGSGKTLLADCLSMITMGTVAPAMKYPDTDEEAAKMALAALGEGDPVFLIDNVERPLQGDWLCSILTSETYKQRVLGRSEMMSVPTTVMILATGNNMVIQGDLSLRAIVCRIDAKVERPELREFSADLRELVAEKRPELVAAGLTIMRAFIATGQNPREHCSTWGRFERWTDLVRAPLIWLGCADPQDSNKAIDDPDRGDLLRALTAWWAVFGDREVTTREVIQEVTHDVPSMMSDTMKALFEIVRDVAREQRGEGLNAKRLGRWLGRHLGRRVEDYQFVKAGERDGSVVWKVDK